MKKKIRLIISIVIILITLAVFAHYLTSHASLLKQLTKTSPAIIIAIAFLYGCWFTSLAFILHASLKLCLKKLTIKDNLLLTAYSTIVNFFVLGQGGPAVRGAYLKKKHDLQVRTYIFVTLLYLGLYGLVSAVLLVAGNEPWWLTLGVIILIGLLGFFGSKFYIKKAKIDKESLNLSYKNLAYLLGVTILQSVIQIAIYFVELHSVNHSITLRQTITYTGAANFALFVALTPGAIGIRETFLIFSERLHHISSANIVSANIIDRSVFLVFLGVLSLAVAAFHAQEKLSIKQSSKIGEKTKTV
jgi:uncharacterized membrane protein YbhN (UPF0104 family)